MKGRPVDRVENLLFCLFMAILVWAPLPFASNRTWTSALLAVLTGGLLCAWLTLYLFRRVDIDPGVWHRARLPLALLLLVQLWVCVQLLPLPPGWVERLSPMAARWHLRDGWISLSLDPQLGKYYLMRGCTYSAAFFLALALVNSHRRVKILLQVLVFSGTFQAAYGALMVLSGLELGFFVQKYVGQGVATGTFVNRNHLAGYLVMCLAAGIGLMMSQLDSSQPVHWRERLRRWLRLLLSPKIRLRIYLAVMVVALVLTRARMGNIAFFSSLALAGCLAVFAGRRVSIRVVLLLASLFLVDMLILSNWFGLDQLVQRLEQTSPGGEGRIWSNQYSLNYLADFLFSGSGGGSFYGVFPNYQGPKLEGYHLHAHNDYLEFAAELGLAATALLLAFVSLALLSACRLQFQRRTPLYKAVGFTVTMTIIWAAIHSTSDFNLQIPANALTFVVILSLAFICRDLKPAIRRRIA